MIFFLTFCLGVIAMAPAAQHAGISKAPSSPDMMEITKVNETLVLFERKHTTNTTLRCQSSKKIEEYDQTHYLYAFRAMVQNGTSPVYFVLYAQVTFAPLRNKTIYKARYTDQNGTNVTLRMKAMDPNGGCFVILIHKSSGVKGCDLLVPKSKLQEKIPDVCRNYYDTKCNGTSLVLYDTSCIFE